jgi:hypothetical protein
MKESSDVMQRASRWKTYQNSITAYVVGTTVTVQNNAGSAVSVPVTTPEGTKVLGLLGLPAGAFGTAYAGERSAYQQVGWLGTLKLGLPSGAGYPVPATAKAPATTTTVKAPDKKLPVLRESAAIGPFRTGEITGSWTSR